MNLREGDNVEIVQNDRLCRCIVQNIRMDEEKGEKMYTLKMDGYTYTFYESKLHSVMIEG